MNLDFHSLPLNEILWPTDIPEQLFDSTDQASLLSLLGKFGQIHPLLVLKERQGCFRLLAGHTWYLAMQAAGHASASCQILPADTMANEVFSLQILHQQHHNTLSPVLQAYILHQAQNCLTENDLLNLLPLMHHKPQQYILLDLLNLLQLDQAVLMAMHRGQIPMKAGKALARLSCEEQQILARLICRYQLGGSKQQKLLEMMTEIALRTQQTVRDILQSWEVQRISEQGNGPQETANLLAYLTACCYPARVEAEERFQKLVQTLGLPQGISIEHCPAFEDDSLEVRLHFNTAESLLNSWNLVKKITLS